MGPPVTYHVNGVQHVSVMAGLGGFDGLYNDPKRGKAKPGHGRILTFALGGTATLRVPPFGHTEPPTPAISVNASRETIRQGKLLYEPHCAMCHGKNAVAGPLPDLRYATKEVHDQFEAIVIGGARAPLGMPSFQDLLTAEQVRAIQAYVLSRARESARPSSN
jgi:quinohemoprotein ethanol dehydrogenase